MITFKSQYLLDPAEFYRVKIAEHGEIGPETTNDELEQLAEEYLDLIRDEGSYMTGSLLDELIAQRDAMR